MQGEIEVYRYKKVFFGAKSSPFLLQVVLKQHLESFISESEMASQLLCNLYMDDPENSMEDTEKAREFWHEAVCIFKDDALTCINFGPTMKICSMSFQAPKCSNSTKYLGLAGT